MLFKFQQQNLPPEKRFHTRRGFLLSYLLVFQVLDLGSVVAVSLTMAEHFEPGHADGVHHRTTIRKKLHITDLRDTRVIL